MSTEKDASLLKNTAVNYLLIVKTEEFVDNLSSNISDHNLLVYLAYYLKTYNSNLKDKLIEENKKSEDNMLFLKEKR